MPRPPSFDEEDVSDKPNWVRNNPPLDRADRLHGRPLPQAPAVDARRRRHDRAPGGHLKKNGELNNTYIFFTSDNGFHLGQRRLTTGKWTAYEEDIRVPLIVRGPGVPEGRTLPHLVLNNDFAPTRRSSRSQDAVLRGRALAGAPLTDDPPSPNNWRQAFLVEAAASEGRGPPSPLADEGSHQAAADRRPAARGLATGRAVGGVVA